MVQQSSLPVIPVESNDTEDEMINEKQRLVPHNDEDQGIL